MTTECQKTKYPSKKDAVTVKNWRTKGRHKKRRGIRHALRVYACPLCGFWHITHQVREIQKYHVCRKPKPGEVPDEYMMIP